jgi:hypothetical protein
MPLRRLGACRDLLVLAQVDDAPDAEHGQRVRARGLERSEVARAEEDSPAYPRRTGGQPADVAEVDGAADLGVAHPSVLGARGGTG